LRLHAYRDFAAAQQLADEAAFEPSGYRPALVSARERLQDATAEAQSIFLTQLAIANQRQNVGPAGLSDTLIEGVRSFDASVAESLAAIADRAQAGVARSVPDWRARLAAATARHRPEGRTIAT